MEPRYSLRFESGERRGETIPITASGFSVGRRPGSSLQILDNSVSGKHAEFLIDAQGVVVKDADSTNGTRVGELRVAEQRLHHGDHIFFGNIEFVLLDAQMGDSATPVEALSKTKSVPGPDGVQRVSADLVARSKKVSRTGLVVVVLAVLAGGVWWYLNRESGGGAGNRVARAITPVPGDLLADEASFESEHDTWSSAENAPQAFFRSAQGRYSGAVGLFCELAPAASGADGAAGGAGSAGTAGAAGTATAGPEWALHRSRSLDVDAGRELVAAAHLRASSGVKVRLGIEFGHASTESAALAAGAEDSAKSEGPSGSETPGGAPASGASSANDTLSVWSSDVTASEFEPRELVALVPPGFDRARVLILARATDGGGSAAADDVSVIQRPAQGAPPTQVGEFRVETQGTPPTQVFVVKGDRVLVSGLEFTRANASPGWESAPISIQPMAGSPDPAQAGAAPARIVIRCDGAHDVLRLRASGDLIGAGLATIAVDEAARSAGDPAVLAGGYKTHASDFQRAGVKDLLLGGKGQLVRLLFDAPVRVRGVPEGAAVRITIDGGPALSSCAMQLEFKEERVQAGNLAYAARNAEKKGDLGECLKQWTMLLDTYPYEESLVNEAEAARARLVERGLSELREVRAESERARFFRLVDLYRQCRDKALATGARYAGSVVDREAQALARDVDKDLDGLEADLARVERARLASILQALELQKATGLAGEVRAYLESTPGGKQD